MSKSRIPSDDRKTNRPLSAAGPKRFLGLSLSGGKTDKACISILEYYERENKVFLKKLYANIKTEKSISTDLVISGILDQYRSEIEMVAVDHPWKLPQCLRCDLICPGFETCQEPHIQWFWNEHEKSEKSKKLNRLFTPYTQRCVETHISSQLEQSFEISHAMGANSAPLLARALFLKRRSQTPWIEVFPPLSVWRIGRFLNMKKSDLRSYRKSAIGEGCRKQILKSLQEHDVVFLYKEDVQMMGQNVHAFDSFICAYTAFLKFTGQTVGRPRGFPEAEDWVEFPKESLQI